MISPAVFRCIILHRKLVVCNLIQTILFEKCNIRSYRVLCRYVTISHVLLLPKINGSYNIYNIKYISVVWSTLASLAPQPPQHKILVTGLLGIRQTNYKGLRFVWFCLSSENCCFRNFIVTLTSSLLF